MTNNEVINFLNQVRKILLGDKSWLESTIQPINEAFDIAISALQAQDSLIARLKSEAIKRNVQYMKSGDRYLIGFVDGMRLARSIVDGSIDEPKYVYPSEGMSDD